MDESEQSNMKTSPVIIKLGQKPPKSKNEESKNVLVSPSSVKPFVLNLSTFKDGNKKVRLKLSPSQLTKLCEQKTSATISSSETVTPTTSKKRPLDEDSMGMEQLISIRQSLISQLSKFPDKKLDIVHGGDESELSEPKKPPLVMQMSNLSTNSMLDVTHDGGGVMSSGLIELAPSCSGIPSTDSQDLGNITDKELSIEPLKKKIKLPETNEESSNKAISQVSSTSNFDKSSPEKVSVKIIKSPIFSTKQVGCLRQSLISQLSKLPIKNFKLVRSGVHPNTSGVFIVKPSNIANLKTTQKDVEKSKSTYTIQTLTYDPSLSTKNIVSNKSPIKGIKFCNVKINKPCAKLDNLDLSHNEELEKALNSSSTDVTIEGSTFSKTEFEDSSSFNIDLSADPKAKLDASDESGTLTTNESKIAGESSDLTKVQHFETCSDLDDCTQPKENSNNFSNDNFDTISKGEVVNVSHCSGTSTKAQIIKLSGSIFHTKELNNTTFIEKIQETSNNNEVDKLLIDPSESNSKLILSDNGKDKTEGNVVRKMIVCPEISNKMASLTDLSSECLMDTKHDEGKIIEKAKATNNQDVSTNSIRSPHLRSEYIMDIDHKEETVVPDTSKIICRRTKKSNLHDVHFVLSNCIAEVCSEVDKSAKADFYENIDSKSDDEMQSESFPNQNSEYEVLDDCESIDNDDDDDELLDIESDISTDEIDAMLEEGLGNYVKQNDKSDELQHEVKQKVILKVRGKDHFEVLPEGWIEVIHNSGMPIYLHKQTRVCSVSKPYFLGPGSTRKHEIPITAIPCLHYLKELEKEQELEREKELEKERELEKQRELEIQREKDKEEGEIEESEGEDNESKTKKNKTKQNSGSSKVDSTATTMGAGLVLPSANLESVKDNKITGSLDYLAIREYCEKRFEFQTITVKRFKTWYGRRKHQKLMKRKQRPFLPDNTQLITCPLPSSAGKSTIVGSTSKREFIMNPTGKSPVCILHEYVQHTLRLQPRYIFKELESASTPYGAVVIINDMEYGCGYGSSKKVAKAEAARNALEILIPKIRSFVPDNEFDREDFQDVEFFDQVRVEDPRVCELSIKAGQPYPYQILLECLKRNYGMGDTEVTIDIKNLKHQKNEFIMKVGKHSASVVCKNKRDGKHRASQAILQQLHPHIHTWGSLLRMYGKGSCKTMKEKKEEEQRITELQSKACVNRPNLSILRKLKEEMLKYHSKKKSKKPLGKLAPIKIPFFSVNGSNLKSIEL